MSTNLQLDRKALAAAWRANKITDKEYQEGLEEAYRDYQHERTVGLQDEEKEEE